MQGRNPAAAGGFTLFDLLITLTLIAILAAVSLPSLNDFSHKQTAEETSQGLLAQLQAARSLAATSGKWVLICGSNDGSRCVQRNFSQVMVFIDNNHNHQLDDEETHLNIRRFDTSRGRLRLTKPYIQFNAAGYASPASFIYCPVDPRKRQLIQRVTTNLTGRIYLAQPSSPGDEVRMPSENGREPAIDCSPEASET